MKEIWYCHNCQSPVGCFHVVFYKNAVEPDVCPYKQSDFQPDWNKLESKEVDNFIQNLTKDGEE